MNAQTIPNVVVRWNELAEVDTQEFWTYAREDAEYYAIDKDGQGYFFCGDKPFTERYGYGADSEGWWTQRSGGSWFGFKHDMTGIDWRKTLVSRGE